jgi:serine/threonine protein kinase
MYQLGELISKGNGASIRIGSELHTGVPVVISTYSKKRMRDGSNRQLRREMNLMGSIGYHPNIVSLREVLHSKSKVHLVSQLCISDSLEHMMSQPEQHLDGPTAKRFFVQLVAGLQHLHDAGFAHCNIKPETLLLDSHSTLMIGELNSCAYVQQAEGSKDALLRTPAGTLDYLAPEVLNASCGYNGKIADVWSAGVVLYTWLAGFTPFQGASVGELFSSISSGSFQWPKGFSNELKHLLSGILTVRPAERLSLAQIQAHPWLRAAQQTNMRLNKLALPPRARSFSAAAAPPSCSSGTQSKSPQRLRAASMGMCCPASHQQQQLKALTLSSSGSSSASTSCSSPGPSP